MQTLGYGKYCPKYVIIVLTAYAYSDSYSKTCVKWPLKNRQNKDLGAFCNTFDLHNAIDGLENQFVVFLRVVVLDRFYCIS